MEDGLNSPIWNQMLSGEFSNLPIYVMFVGVPASGKSTFYKKYADKLQNFYVASTDNYLEAKAKMYNITYDAAFDMFIDEAHTDMNSGIRAAIDERMNVIHDQTNITRKSRKAKLVNVPDVYIKVAIVFKTPNPEVLKERLASRPGKTIPAKIMQGMIDRFEHPTYSEGFDYIIESF